MGGSNSGHSDTSAQRQDSWGSGWNEDDWGNNSESTQEPAAPRETPLTKKYREQQAAKAKASGNSSGTNDWDSWSNDKKPAAAAKTKSSEENEFEKWLNDDDWSGTGGGSSTKKSSKKSKAAQASKFKATEPAVANDLIDLGGDGGETGNGWEEEKWATEDDGWQDL